MNKVAISRKSFTSAHKYYDQQHTRTRTNTLIAYIYVIRVLNLQAANRLY